MTRRRAILLALSLLFALGACGPATSPTPSPGPSPSPSHAPTSPVVGVVTGVDSQGLNAVKGFTLRTDGGATIEFEIGQLENATEFPPGHLQEHVATSSPVRVFFRVVGPRLVVYRIEDAD